MRGSNETYGLQNRTYIVTTILVSTVGAELRDGGFVWGGAAEPGETKKDRFSFSFMIEFLRVQQTAVSLAASIPACLTRVCQKLESLYLCKTRFSFLVSLIHIVSFYMFTMGSKETTHFRGRKLSVIRSSCFGSDVTTRVFSPRSARLFPVPPAYISEPELLCSARVWQQGRKELSSQVVMTSLQKTERCWSR